MRQIIFLFIVLGGFAAVMECAPISPIGPQEINEMVIPAIKSAEKPLRTMLDSESAEIAEMQDVKHTINHNLPNAPRGPTSRDFAKDQRMVTQAAKRIELDTNKANHNEDMQQSAALATLHKVDNIIAGFIKRGVNEAQKKDMLGEASSPMEDALHNLQAVSAVLTKGTKSSLTKHRIMRMHKEARGLEEESGGKGQMKVPMGAKGMKGPMPPMPGMPGGKGKLGEAQTPMGGKGIQA